jgi:hypothetical protein
VVKYRQNKSPFAIALGDWFPLKTYFLTSKASPNDSEIVIDVIIIVIGEAHLVLHNGGIIAQTACLDRVFYPFFCRVMLGSPCSSDLQRYGRCESAKRNSTHLYFNFIA